MVLACNGVCNVVPCLLRKPVEIKPATHLDVVNVITVDKPDNIPKGPIDITSVIGKRDADLSVAGAMGTHTIQTNSGTAKFCAAKTPPKDIWSAYETLMFLAYSHKCLRTRGNKKVFEAHKMHEFWVGLVQRQGEPSPDKKLNARTVENLQNKWATCVKGDKYARVMEVAHAKDPAADVNFEEVETVMKRLREPTGAPATPRRAPASATPTSPPDPATSPLETTTASPDTTATSPGPREPTTQGTTDMPSDDAIKKWFSERASGMTRDAILKTTLKWFRDEAETHFALKEGTLGMKRHIFEKCIDQLTA